MRNERRRTNTENKSVAYQNIEKHMTIITNIKQLQKHNKRRNQTEKESLVIYNII